MDLDRLRSLQRPAPKAGTLPPLPAVKPKVQSVAPLPPVGTPEPTVQAMIPSGNTVQTDVSNVTSEGSVEPEPVSTGFTGWQARLSSDMLPEIDEPELSEDEEEVYRLMEEAIEREEEEGSFDAIPDLEEDLYREQEETLDTMDETGHASLPKAVMAYLKKELPYDQLTDSEIRKLEKAQMLGEVVTPREKWQGKKPDRSKMKKPDWGNANGLYSQKELDFFINMGLRKLDVMTGKEYQDIIRNPYGETITDEEVARRTLSLSVGLSGDKAVSRTADAKFDRRHLETLEFLANFRMATARHISNLFSERPSVTMRRLNQMERGGLVVKYETFNTDPVWYITRLGMDLTGYGYNVPSSTNFKPETIPHKFTVNYLASNIWGANLNVLMEEEWPLKNKHDLDGHTPIYGDYLVSEFAIASSLSRITFGKKKEVYRPIIDRQKDALYQAWEREGKETASPEFLPGNEFLWSLFPPTYTNKSYHVPDMVVSRKRGPNGEPRSIAIEVELSLKSEKSIWKTLESYKADHLIYQKVVWIVHNVTVYNRLVKVQEEVGLSPDRMVVLPIITADGIYQGRTPWTL